MTTERDVRVLWQALFSAETAFYQRRMLFCRQPQGRVDVLREALRTIAERGAVLRVLLCGCIPEAEIRLLFAELIDLASSSHADIHLVHDVILSLDKGWVVANIEAAAEPALRDEGEFAYRRYLELYTLLDAGLTARLLSRALASADPGIREAGENFETSA